MTDFSLKLYFRNSKAKNFSEVLGYAKKFDDFQRGEVNVIDISRKELFEKWEFFNNAFLIAVNWKGTILEFDGMKWHSHYDMMQLFYGLQESQSRTRNIAKLKASQTKPVHQNKPLFWEIPVEIIENNWDWYLDAINHLKDLNKPKNDDGK